MKIILGVSLCFGLSACVSGTSISTSAFNQPLTTVSDGAVYLARNDGAFTVPSVPIEKVPEQFRRQTVSFKTDEVPGTIVINPSARFLYLVTGKNKAVRYGIAVGRAGFEWSGVAIVNERKQWPTWTPPPEMIVRKPELAKFEKGQPGGLTNPLGARALYLTTNGIDYGYRIHGTPEWQSIGSNASSGCIRMINQDVIDLFDRVPAGTKVVVLNADGSIPTALKLPPPAPKVKKSAPVVKVSEPLMPALPPPPPLSSDLIAPVIATATPATAITAAPTALVPVTPACSEPLVNGLCPSDKP